MKQLLEEGPATVPRRASTGERHEEWPPAAAAASGRRFERGPSASGHRLLRAFRELERFPSMASSRDRLLALLAQTEASPAELVQTIESDPALTIAVLRAAARGGRECPGANVALAVTGLSREELRAAAERIPVFHFLARRDKLDAVAERFRHHAVSTQRIAEQLRKWATVETTEALPVAALLHDIGKVALVVAYSRYEELLSLPGTPEQRLALERSQLGFDHAVVGGVLARRLGLGDALATAIERHHAEYPTGDAALVGLADLLEHYVSGRPVQRSVLVQAALAVGMDERTLEIAIHDLPLGGTPRVPRFARSPLTRRQAEILKGLERGSVYKQIAAELGVSESTIRTHIHALYKTLGVVDRAQAVLLAAKHGWL